MAMKFSLVKIQSTLQLRTGKKVTIDHIIDMTGISRQTLYNLDNKAFPSVHYDTMEKLRRNLGLTLDEMAEFDPPLEES